MKLLVLMTIGAVGACAGSRPPEPGSVMACVQDNAGVSPAVRNLAQALASRAFASAGVRIDWHCGQAPDVVIHLTSETPENLRPGALAYARAYEGSTIRVFYDRIHQLDPAPTTPFRLGDVLGNVLVHEITHVLEKSDSHSDTGVMKPRWGHEDHVRMQQARLPFTDADISLIRSGLALRNR